MVCLEKVASKALQSFCGVELHSHHRHTPEYLHDYDFAMLKSRVLTSINFTYDQVKVEIDVGTARNMCDTGQWESALALGKALHDGGFQVLSQISLEMYLLILRWN